MVLQGSMSCLARAMEQESRREFCQLKELKVTKKGRD
jgi:hypothetical protein